MHDTNIKRLADLKEFDVLRDAAEALCSHNDDGETLEVAVFCKISGHTDAARALLEHLVKKAPTYAAAHYELAVIYRDLKRLLEAVPHARRAYELATNSFRFGVFYAHMLFANGAWDEGRQQLSRVQAENDEETAELLAMGDFGDYLRDFPRNRALFITQELRSKYYWMNAREVAKDIEQAIIQKRPFSLIRLGDGDGAHFRVSEENEKSYPHLHKATRSAHTKFLLGVDVDPVFTGYTGLTSKLAEYVCEADILGIAYPSWIAHEYDIASPITLNCLMNINRFFYENDRVPNLSLCDQLIHIQLHDQKLLEPIVKRLPAVTVISCLDGLPGRIREMFGIEDVEFIKIPSETYAPHLYGETRLRQSAHYPHVFWPTIQRLSAPHEGRVFLIAAGTFGKYYASIIKRHGGIALDLGSLVDGWMRLVSRPGYEAFATE